MVEVSDLNDDLLGQILERVNDPDDRKRDSEVCKQWLSVEGLTRTSLRLLQLSFLRQVLPRFPNLVAFRTSVPYLEEADFKFIAQTCPKLETLDLSTAEADSWFLSRTAEADSWFLPMTGLFCLSTGGGLSELSKLSLRGRHNVAIERWLHELGHDHLTYLDLGNCSLVDDNAAEAIGLLCTCLSYLNLRNADITDNGLRLLSSGRCSKTLKTLVLALCYNITDYGVSHLRNMQCLEELDLGSYVIGTDVSDIGVRAALSGNRSIKKLNLCLLRNVSNQSMVFIFENCPNLEFLDVSDCNVTAAGIRALTGHKCLECLVWRTGLEYFWPDIEGMVLGCKSLKSIVLSKTQLYWIPESFRRIVSHE